MCVMCGRFFSPFLSKRGGGCTKAAGVIAYKNLCVVTFILKCAVILIVSFLYFFIVRANGRMSYSMTMC